MGLVKRKPTPQRQPPRTGSLNFERRPTTNRSPAAGSVWWARLLFLPSHLPTTALAPYLLHPSLFPPHPEPTRHITSSCTRAATRNRDSFCFFVLFFFCGCVVWFSVRCC